MSNDHTIADASRASPDVAKPRDLSHLYRGAARPKVPSATELAQRLRRLREEVGYSVEQLARHCGVTASAVSAFENDGTADAATLLALIASFSWSWRLDEAFLAPRLPKVDDMLAYQRARR